jgi:hypothetical protein
MGALLTLIAAIAVIAVLTAGCSGEEPGSGGKTTANEVWERIRLAANLEEMKQGDGDKLLKLYSITADEIEDFVLYTASSNVKADELVLIRLKDAKYTGGVKERIMQHIEAQSAKFKDYRPAEYALVERHVLTAKGPFVFFAVSKQADALEQAFNEALK